MKTPEQIIDYIADQYEVEANDLTGDSPERIHTEPRQVAMYLIYRYCNINGAKLGKIFSKGQSNIVFANNKIVQNIRVNRRFNAFINETVNELGL